jgi:hypothetical protein
LHVASGGGRELHVASGGGPVGPDSGGDEEQMLGGLLLQFGTAARLLFCVVGAGGNLLVGLGGAVGQPPELVL